MSFSFGGYTCPCEQPCPPQCCPQPQPCPPPPCCPLPCWPQPQPCPPPSCPIPLPCPPCPECKPLDTDMSQSPQLPCMDNNIPIDPPPTEPGYVCVLERKESWECVDEADCEVAKTQSQCDAGCPPEVNYDCLPPREFC